MKSTILAVLMLSAMLIIAGCDKQETTTINEVYPTIDVVAPEEPAQQESPPAEQAPEGTTSNSA